MINLDEHIIYNIELKIDTVPLSIAKRAIKEALDYKRGEDKLDEAMQLIKNSISEINTSITNVENND